MKNTRFTYEDSIKRIKSIGGKPIAVEAQWDGDTYGWFLRMFVVTQKGILRKRIETHHIGNIALGGDIRIFEGRVPPYPEAKLAKEIGEKLSKNFNLEFFFPSPVNPDTDCPRWIEKDDAINCEDCDKLILPSSSPYLPKNICYSCNLNRKQNDKIKNDKSHLGRVNIFQFRNNEYHKIWSASTLDMIPITKFLSINFENSSTNSIQIFTLNRGDINKLKQDLEFEIDFLLKNHERSIVDDKRSNLMKVKKIIYKEKEIEFMDRFDPQHETILKLIWSLNSVNKILEKDYQLKIYINKGLTYRDDSFLRFLNYIEEGNTKVENVMNNYKNILSNEEVIYTIKKLDVFGCLICQNEDLKITTNGRNIL